MSPTNNLEGLTVDQASDALGLNRRYIWQIQSGTLIPTEEQKAKMRDYASKLAPRETKDVADVPEANPRDNSNSA